jgi:hypothetical protein
LATPAKVVRVALPVRANAFCQLVVKGKAKVIGVPAKHKPAAPVTVKLEADWVPPRELKTWIAAVGAPAGIVMVRLLLEVLMMAQDMPPMKTEVTAAKFRPVIVTVVPTGPEVGEKLVIVGAAPPPFKTLKLLELVTLPAVVNILIGPVVAPTGTVAEILVDELTVKDVTLVPLNWTESTPVKFWPVMLTLVPVLPLVGLKLVILGTGAPIMKLKALQPVPTLVVTHTVPVVAPAGTCAKIVEALETK